MSTWRTSKSKSVLTDKFIMQINKDAFQWSTSRLPDTPWQRHFVFKTHHWRSFPSQKAILKQKTWQCGCNQCSDLESPRHLTPTLSLTRCNGAVTAPHEHHLTLYICLYICLSLWCCRRKKKEQTWNDMKRAGVLANCLCMNFLLSKHTSFCRWGRTHSLFLREHASSVQ